MSISRVWYRWGTKEKKKKSSRWEDKWWTNIWFFWGFEPFDFDLAGSNPTISHMNVCNDIPPYPVWDKKVQQFRTYGAVSPFEDNNPNVLQDTLSTKDLPVAKSSVVQKDMEQKSLFWGFQLTLWP